MAAAPPAVQPFISDACITGQPEIMLLKASLQTLDLVGCLFNPVSAFYVFFYFDQPFVTSQSVMILTRGTASNTWAL